MVTSDEIRAKRVEALWRSSSHTNSSQDNDQQKKKEPPTQRRSNRTFPKTKRTNKEKIQSLPNNNSNTNKAPSPLRVDGVDNSANSNELSVTNIDSTTNDQRGVPKASPLSNQELSTTKVQPFKPKKKRPTKPAHQLLKDALTRAGASPNALSSLPTTTDWDKLQSHIRSGWVIANSNATFRELAFLYGNIQSERSSNLSNVSLTMCLQEIAASVQTQAAQLLETQATNPTFVPSTKAPWIAGSVATAQSTNDEMDLFTAYDTDTSNTNHNNHSQLPGAVGDLFTLLDQHHSSLTTAFLDWNETTSVFVLNVLLGRIAETFNGTKPTEVLARLTALSTMVSLSVSVRKALGQAFSEYQRQETTGRELEERDMLQPLLALAGYSLPWPNDNDDTKNLWKVQLQTGIPQYPVGALLRTSHTVVNNCMEFGRRVQASAQGIAMTILGQVMKLSAEHKRAVFDWARHVSLTKYVLRYTTCSFICV